MNDLPGVDRKATAWSVSALAVGLAVLAAALATRSGRNLPVLAPLCGPAEASDWTFDAWVTAPLALSGVLYGIGVVRLGARSRHGSVQAWRVVAFSGGWLALAFALVSPLHRWGEGLFTAHMVEHEIVMAVAAPLLVIARPGAAMMWALPRGLRHAIGQGIGAPGTRAAWAFLSRPGVATLLHGVAIWVWHAPVLFDAAVVNVAAHRVQHLAFLLTALLFWWALLRRDAPGAAAGHLFVTMLHTSALGALLAVAPRILYPDQTARSLQWGLTALEDQQLAGLVMWVPAGTIYAGAVLLLVASWIRRSGTSWRSAHAVAPL